MGLLCTFNALWRPTTVYLKIFDWSASSGRSYWSMWAWPAALTAIWRWVCVPGGFPTSGSIVGAGGNWKEWNYSFSCSSGDQSSLSGAVGKESLESSYRWREQKRSCEKRRLLTLLLKLVCWGLVPWTGGYGERPLWSKRGSVISWVLLQTKMERVWGWAEKLFVGQYKAQEVQVG